MRRLGFALGRSLWIVLAMVGARSAAMAFNRILDAEIDAQESAHAHPAISQRDC